MKEEKIKGTLSFFRNFENAIVFKNEKRKKKAKGILYLQIVSFNFKNKKIQFKNGKREKETNTSHSNF